VRIVLLTKRTLAHGFGGVEGYVHHVARAAGALGHEVVVLASAHPGGARAAAHDGYRVE
jgi:hypothetical protein